MNRENYTNIQTRFQEKTGVTLPKSHPAPGRRLVVLVSVAAAFCLLAAFSLPLFSALDGDALTLHGEYLGDGIVSVTAQNHSRKDLNFEDQVKLMEWGTGQEVPATGGEALFSDVCVPAHSEVVFTIDLTKAYDCPALEASHPKQYHYLVLTNQSFLRGQQWQCTVHFTETLPVNATPDHTIVTMEPEILANVAPELQWYFQTEHYAGAFSFNPHHYEYLQQVHELLQRSNRRVVEAVSGVLIAEPILDGVIIDGTYPADLQYQLGSMQQSTLSDGFGRLVGGTDMEHIKYIAYQLPCSDQGKIIYSVPLLYFSTFPVSEIQSDSDCAFIHGQLLSFAQLEDYKVYEDGDYVCYNVTHLFYTDLETYLRSYITADPFGSEPPVKDVMSDHALRRAEAVLAYYEEHLKIMNFEAYRQVRPDCRVEGCSDDSNYHTGLQGIVTSNCDMEYIEVIITDAAGQEVYRGTITPEDPRYYDLSQAEEASVFLQSLPEETYTLDIWAKVDAKFYSYKGLYSCVLNP